MDRNWSGISEYRIAGNVCEEEKFAVCTFTVNAQIFHHANIIFTK